MAATRDRLIHGYFSIDLDIIWDIITNKILGLHNEIVEVLIKWGQLPFFFCEDAEKGTVPI
jgi:uncharacterized protein with HEPN domain